MTLPIYFQREIILDKMWGSGTLSEPNKSNLQRWYDRIDCDLSPENLTCDGELSRAQVDTKYKELMAAKKYLDKISQSA